MTPIQVVKLPTSMVTSVPFPFDKSELELWNVEFWGFWKLYKHVQEKKKKKKFDFKRKRTFLYLNFSSIATLKKGRFSMSTLFLEHISILINTMYLWFLIFVNTRHGHQLIRLKHEETSASTKINDQNLTFKKSTSLKQWFLPNKFLGC